MKILLIDDEPELKAFDKGLDLSTMVVAKTVRDGREALDKNERFDKLYLDNRLIGGTGLEILTWLSDHLDKVPKEIISISFMTPDSFYPMVQALQASRERIYHGQ
jgi:DNA-binding response OmpR family regulator